MSFGPLIGTRIEVHDEESAASYSGALRKALESAFGDIVFHVSTNQEKGAIGLTIERVQLRGRDQGA